MGAGTFCATPRRYHECGSAKRLKQNRLPEEAACKQWGVEGVDQIVLPQPQESLQTQAVASWHSSTVSLTQQHWVGELLPPPLSSFALLVEAFVIKLSTLMERSDNTFFFIYLAWFNPI